MQKDLESKIKFVPMGGIDVSSVLDEKPFIGTASLASCAGIAIYDDKNQVGGVAHVFFNDKISIAVYLKDSTGREIPSTGRSVIINNPNPFSDLKYECKALIRKADELGGQKYKFIAFNIDHGCRTREQNNRLKEVVEETIKEFISTGKISQSDYRNEREFILDTKTGAILHYDF